MTWGGQLLLLLSSCLLCVQSQVDVLQREQPPVIMSGAHTSGQGRLDRNMVQDKE